MNTKENKRQTKFTLEISIKQGVTLSTECESRGTVAAKAQLIKEQGIVDEDGNIYSPSDIKQVTCLDLLKH